MARPKKVLESKVLEQSNNVNDNSINPNDELIRKLLAKVEELEKQLKNTANKPDPEVVEQSSEKFDEPESEPEDIDLEISATKYIPIMSLCREKLNLSTEPYGRGKIFSFPSFGSTRQIMYSELVNVIHNHQKFLEEGRFIILNNLVVRKHGLSEIYENILNKQQIEKILACNSKESLAIYKSANEKQRNIINQMLVSRIRDNAEVDLNIVAAISKIANVDLNDLAEEARKFVNLQKADTENAS